jgi:hypothetical protein
MTPEHIHADLQRRLLVFDPNETPSEHAGPSTAWRIVTLIAGGAVVALLVMALVGNA